MSISPFRLSWLMIQIKIWLKTAVVPVLSSFSAYFYFHTLKSTVQAQLYHTLLAGAQFKCCNVWFSWTGGSIIDTKVKKRVATGPKANPQPTRCLRLHKSSNICNTGFRNVCFIFISCIKLKSICNFYSKSIYLAVTPIIFAKVILLCYVLTGWLL